MTTLGVRVAPGTLDVASLVPGRDLTLTISEAEAVRAPTGVYAGDFLSPPERVEIDELSGRVLREWRAAVDETLTLDGFSLTWAWELELLASVVIPSVRAVAAVRRAVDELRPSGLELPAGSHLATPLADAALSVDPALRIIRRPSPLEPALLGRIPRPQRTLGTKALDLVRGLGLPSRLRRGATIVVGYWSIAAVHDLLLASERHRPAVLLDARPPGIRRTLEAAQQGGWVGVPSRRDVERARTELQTACAALPEPRLEVYGVDIGPVTTRASAELARRRGPADLALARVLRHELAQARPSSILLPFDSTPLTRALVQIGRELSVPTIAVAHAGYWFPAIVQDLEASDEIAVWSMHALDHVRAGGRVAHVTGYPRGRSPHPPRETRSRPLRIVVLDQPELPLSAIVDARMPGLHYRTALRAIARIHPDATVVLRPHPSRGRPTAEAVRALHPEQHVEIDVRTSILDVFDGADVCIGSVSTATLEAAYAGVPVVVLDLTGVDWPWPLGGSTDVPVARSEDELSDRIQALVSDGGSPGRDALLTALGASPDTAVEPYAAFVPAFDAGA